MTSDSEQHAAARERLSALMDGELDGDATAGACLHWREHAEVRSSWHAYHLIGDVLRSDDLACDPGRDAQFLEAFRARLATEPVVLAPRPLATPATAVGTRSRRWAWMAPSAAAAGFAVVAGVLVLTRAPDLSPTRTGGEGIAQVQPASSGGLQLAASPAIKNPVTSVSEPQIFVANGQLIRDARLDRYLAAHKQFAGSSALGVPSGFLRNATADAADR